MWDGGHRAHTTYMWRPIVCPNTIPSNRDLTLAVEDHDGFAVLEFPCRWADGCWIHGKTGRLVDVNPTHWREWIAD
jgi:hypothetical protein